MSIPYLKYLRLQVQMLEVFRFRYLYRLAFLIRRASQLQKSEILQNTKLSECQIRNLRIFRFENMTSTCCQPTRESTGPPRVPYISVSSGPGHKQHARALAVPTQGATEPP